MKLIEENIKIKEISLDIHNPRFMNIPGNTQEAILAYIKPSKEYKTLLKSMKEDIKWVNKIVVKKTDENKYIVVEGNHRMACLKTGNINGITEETEIPVLVATKEEGESDSNYNKELLLVQGISNVMVVNPWGPEAKARHVYNVYNYEIGKNDGRTQAEIITSISESFALSRSTCRRAIISYSFYNAIKDTDSDDLKPGEWSYLEGITYNNSTKDFFGFNSSKLEFTWKNTESKSTEEELEINDEDVDTYEQRLSLIPKLIRADNIKASEFRDKFPKLIDLFNDDSDENVDEDSIGKLAENTKTWSDLIGEDNIDSKDTWSKNLKKVISTLKSFPTLQDWVKDDSIKKSIEEVINISTEIYNKSTK